MLTMVGLLSWLTSSSEQTSMLLRFQIEMEAKARKRELAMDASFREREVRLEERTMSMLGAVLQTAGRSGSSRPTYQLPSSPLPSTQ